VILKLKTFKTSTKATIGTMTINEKAECFTLEDTFREEKIAGETRIPRGLYKIKLRTHGSMHKAYKKKFGDFHKGMLWLQDVPNFEWIYIHYGNYDFNTNGCILVGSSADLEKDFVGNSIATYKKLYSKVVEPLVSGEDVFIKVGEY